MMGQDPALRPVDESPGNEARQAMRRALAELHANQRAGAR